MSAHFHFHGRWSARLSTASRWLFLAVCVTAMGDPPKTWDFDQIIQTANARYSGLGSATDRIRNWQKLLQNSANLNEREQLERINRFFNQQLVFQDDSRIWGQADYWATPVEALVKGAADCEDYAIVKYFSLRQLGIPSDKLRITYVKALRLNQAHMVLTYYATKGAEPLVLDNLIPDIQPASRRNDLLPVYAFNAEGLYLAGSAGDRRTADSKKLSRWQDLLKKMQAEGFAIGEG